MVHNKYIHEFIKLEDIKHVKSIKSKFVLYCIVVHRYIWQTTLSGCEHVHVYFCSSHTHAHTHARTHTLTHTYPTSVDAARLSALSVSGEVRLCHLGESLSAAFELMHSFYFLLLKRFVFTFAVFRNATTKSQRNTKHLSEGLLIWPDVFTRILSQQTNLCLEVR